MGSVTNCVASIAKLYQDAHNITAQQKRVHKSKEVNMRYGKFANWNDNLKSQHVESQYERSQETVLFMTAFNKCNKIIK